MVDEPLAKPWGEWLARADSGTYLEQRIFVLSPFSWLTTSLVLYAALVCLYSIVATLDHVLILVHTSTGFGLEPRARLAAILALVTCVGLGLQRYSRIKDCEDGAAMNEILTPNAPQSVRTAAPMSSELKLGPATVAGIVVGLLLAILLVPRRADIGPLDHPWTFAWFTAQMLVLGVLFARGVALTRAGRSGAHLVIRDYLVIDLLRIDLLSVWGRSAARNALVWFAVSAAVCLLFVDRTNMLYTIGLLMACAAMGLWVFVGTMALVHRKIRTAKHAELKRLRKEIESLRHRAHIEVDAALKIQGLLALEARIAAAPEWPFDQSTAVRVGASALILTVPWFGQAIAGTVVERIGQVFH